MVLPLDGLGSCCRLGCGAPWWFCNASRAGCKALVFRPSASPPPGAKVRFKPSWRADQLSHASRRLPNAWTHQVGSGRVQGGAGRPEPGVGPAPLARPALRCQRNRRREAMPASHSLRSTHLQYCTHYFFETCKVLPRCVRGGTEPAVPLRAHPAPGWQRGCTLLRAHLGRRSISGAGPPARLCGAVATAGWSGAGPRGKGGAAPDRPPCTSRREGAGGRSATGEAVPPCRSRPSSGSSAASSAAGCRGPLAINVQALSLRPSALPALRDTCSAYHTCVRPPSSASVASLQRCSQIGDSSQDSNSVRCNHRPQAQPALPDSRR